MQASLSKCYVICVFVGKKNIFQSKYRDIIANQSNFIGTFKSHRGTVSLTLHHQVKPGH